MKKQLHPEVFDVGRSFRAIGMSTPTTVEIKTDLLFNPNEEGERVAVVAADAIRCTTTIQAAFGAGVGAVTITVKGGTRGTTLTEARHISEMLGLDLVLGGELHGKPITDGVIGNSPRAATPQLLAGKFLHFSSTNLGATFTELAGRANTFQEAGGFVDIYLVTFANIDALAATLRCQHYDRLFIGTGGFYDQISFEDMVVAGELLDRVGVRDEQADDEARAMLACARTTRSAHGRLEAFHTNWIGRCLAIFGVDADIDAAVYGVDMDPEIYRRMQLIVPVVRWIAGVPVVFPTSASGDHNGLPDT